MGCWNNTCGVTQLPILGGEPVRATLIMRSAYIYDQPRQTGASGTSEPYGMWAPVLPFFRGEYDDYGGVVLGEEGALHEVLTSLIAPYIQEGRDDDASAQYDGPVTRNPKRFGDLLKQVERDRVFLVDAAGKDRSLPLGIWMCHEFAFDLMVKSAKYVPAHPLEAVAKCERLLNACFIRGNNVRDLVTHLFGDDPSVRRAALLTGFGEKVDPSMLPPLNALTPESNALVDSLTETVAFLQQMLTLRKSFHPQTGKGSQDQRYSPHEELARAVLDFVVSKRESGEWWQDEEEG